MPKRSYYTRTYADETIIMSKFDENLEHKTDYELTPTDDGLMYCNCPARIVNCRHVKMQVLLADAAIGDDPIYNHMKSEYPSETIYLDYRSDGKYYWVTKTLLEES